uniref:ARAD1C18810p n=1 Tax=Blastobotrys adeninivorans TaxID=409370 RepID=A0A060T1B0_BLAAD
MSNLKVLVFGQVNNNLNELIAKANSIHNSKNGPFSLLLILGNIITSEDHVDALDLPGYFTSRSFDQLPQVFKEKVSQEDNFGEVSPNLTYLGSTGRFNVAEGLSIAFHGGSQDDGDIIPGPVDILLSHDFPTAITDHSQSAPLLADDVSMSKLVSQAVVDTTPRYHFAPCKGTFWERKPFEWPESDPANRVTRFIALDSYAGAKKWFYAFNILAQQSEFPALPPANLTANPFINNSQKDERAEDTKSTDNSAVLTAIDRPKRPLDTQQPGKKKRKTKTRTVNPDSCFFCLSNPKVDRQLIVSIADESYLALPKGPLTLLHDDIPTHILFIPLPHVPTFSSLPDESKDKVALEKRKYMAAMGQLYGPKDLVPVSFEINRSDGVHAHTQIVFIRKDTINDLKQAFLREAEMNGLKMTEQSNVPAEGDYFVVSLDTAQEYLVIEIAPGSYFDLQFGRKVLASHLEILDRLDWRACAQSPKEEESFGNKFKQAFKPLDFTL